MSLRSASISDAVSRQKFFDCLFNVFKHHQQIVKHFANGFIYNLKKAQLVNPFSQIKSISKQPKKLSVLKLY